MESDLSGEPGAETTLIGLHGEIISIDLTSPERAALDEIFAPYIERGRKLRPMTVKAFIPRKVAETTAEERVEIRAWARAEGYEVADHGQIPNKIVKAYMSTQPASPLAG